MRLLLTTIFFLALIPPFAHSQQMEKENLLQTLPPGYKIGYQTKRGNMLITEFVPERETVGNWTEMVTTQVFLGLKRPTPNEFRQVMQKSWAESCKDAGFADVAAGNENGYGFEVWMLDCPKNEQTGKPERTLLKAIKGNDSFYLVQKAFRFLPEPDQVTRWTQYLRTIQVCDSRLPDRSCPKVSSPPEALATVALAATSTSPPTEPTLEVAPLTREALMVLGARSYQEFCAACHQQSGSGVSSARISSLHQSKVVNDTNQRYLRFVMFNEPKMRHAAWYLAMSPAALASALTYIRVQFSNTNQALVQPGEVLTELAKLSVSAPNVK